MKLRNSYKFKVDLRARLMSTSKLPTIPDIAKYYLNIFEIILFKINIYYIF